MRLLVATKATQGTVEGDFDFGAVPGELVEPFVVCDRDLAGYDDCGCSRAFYGVASKFATTTAVPADVPIALAELRDLVAGLHPESTASEIDDQVGWLVDFGAEYPEGTVLGILDWRLVPR